MAMGSLRMALSVVKRFHRQRVASCTDGSCAELLVVRIQGISTLGTLGTLGLAGQDIIMP